MESSPNNISDNISINSNIVSNLNRLYESFGQEKQAWIYLLSLTNKSNSLLSVIYFFNQKIINEPANPMTLDIIDFLVDFGSINVIREISDIGFMKNVFYLLKRSSGSSPDVQKKGIYLIGKWKEKCNEFPNENFPGFINNYKELYNHHISLPPPGFKMLTYEKYINQHDINNNIQNNNNIISFNNSDLFNNKNNNINNNYYENINFKDSFQNQSKYSFNRDNNINNNIINNNNNSKNNINNNNSDYINNNDNKINTLPEFPKDQFKDSEMFMKPHLSEKININKIEENENENKIVYPIYDEKKNNEKENINNYGQKNGGTPIGNDINENQDMDVPPPAINNEGKDFVITPLSNNIVQKPLNKNKMIESDKDNNNNSYNIDAEFKKIENKNNSIYNNSMNNEQKNNNLNINRSIYMNRSNSSNNQNNKVYEETGFIQKSNIYTDIKNNINNNNNFNNNIKNNNNIYQSNPNINISQNIISYKMNWMDKINLCNQLMNQGYSDNNKERIQVIIREILFELEKNIQTMLYNNNRRADQEVILKIKSDMNQTCHRYEKFIHNESYEGFLSAFDGNECIYMFNKDNLLLSQNQSQNNINIYNNDYNQQNKDENKYVKELKKIGGFMKKGIFNAGKAVKNSTVKGYNYMKDKVNNNDNKNKVNKANNEEEIHDEVFKNYMDNIDNRNNYQNSNNNSRNNNFSNQSNINFNNQNNSYNYNNQNNNFNNQNNNFNNQSNNFNNQNNNFNNQINNFNNQSNNFNNQNNNFNGQRNNNFNNHSNNYNNQNNNFNKQNNNYINNKNNNYNDNFNNNFNNNQYNNNINNNNFFNQNNNNFFNQNINNFNSNNLNFNNQNNNNNNNFNNRNNFNDNYNINN